MTKILRYLPILWLTLAFVGQLLPTYGQVPNGQTPKRVVSGIIRDSTGPLSKATISAKISRTSLGTVLSYIEIRSFGCG